VRPAARAGAEDLLEIMRRAEALHRPSGTLTRLTAPATAGVGAAATGRRRWRRDSGSGRWPEPARGQER
jgi:hypothetical protein